MDEILQYTAEGPDRITLNSKDYQARVLKNRQHPALREETAVAVIRTGLMAYINEVKVFVSREHPEGIIQVETEGETQTFELA